MRAGVTSLGSLILLAGLAGCGPGGPAGLWGQDRAPIFNGSPDDGPAHRAVVAIAEGSAAGFFCSGTLIAADVVLTAAHCLEYRRDPRALEVFFGNDVAGEGDLVPVAELMLHPDYDPLDFSDDLALVRLAAAAPAGVTPIGALPRDLALGPEDVGAEVDFSGFGLTEQGTDGVKLHAAGVIDLVCPGPLACPEIQPWVEPRAFGYSMQSGGPCSGDSGGPAFLLRDGTEYVAGVTSYGDEPCTDYGVSMTVDAAADWIQAFIDGAHAEDCVAAGDEDGDGLFDCDDPDCSLHPDCQGPDACQRAEAVGCGSRIEGTTAGGVVLLGEYGCLAEGEYLGPERAYALAVPPGARVTAEMQPTGPGDLDLFLLPGSASGCEPDRCLDASIEYNPTPERLDFDMPAGDWYLVVDTWDVAGPFELRLDCTGAAEDCGNGFDDDGDGRTDCDDGDCRGVGSCPDGGGGGCGCAAGGGLPGTHWLSLLWAVLGARLLCRRRKSRPIV